MNCCTPVYHKAGKVFDETGTVLMVGCFKIKKIRLFSVGIFRLLKYIPKPSLNKN